MFDDIFDFNGDGDIDFVEAVNGATLVDSLYYDDEPTESYQREEDYLDEDYDIDELDDDIMADNDF